MKKKSKLLDIAARLTLTSQVFKHDLWYQGNIACVNWTEIWEAKLNHFDRSRDSVHVSCEYWNIYWAQMTRGRWKLKMMRYIKVRRILREVERKAKVKKTSKSVSDRAEVWGKRVCTWGGIIVHRLQISVCRNQYECLAVGVFPGPLGICCCCHLLCFSWWQERLQRCQLTVHRQWDFLAFALESSSCLWVLSVQAIPTEYLNYHHFNLELILRLRKPTWKTEKILLR